MTEKFTIDDVIKHDNVGWFLMTLMSESKAAEGSDFPRMFLTPDQKDLEIEIKINGVPVEIRPLIERLFEQYANNVREEAKELLKEHFGELQAKISELENEVEWRVNVIVGDAALKLEIFNAKRRQR